MEVKWILIFLCLEEKKNIKAEGFLVCVCASDEALSFIEAFHSLLGELDRKSVV